MGSTLSPDPTRPSTNFQSFGQYSEFLRSAVADEESLQMGDELQALAVQVEALTTLLQPGHAESADTLAQPFLHLVDALRDHRTMLLALGADWHRFYEFDAHFVALNQFRLLVTRWAMDAAPPTGRLPSPADFDVAAWRLLGAGAMLLDVYEQSRVVQPPAPPPTEPLWGRWRAWWRQQVWPAQEQRQPGRRGRRRSDK